MAKQLVRKIHELMESALRSDDVLYTIPEGIRELIEFLEQLIHNDERLQIDEVKKSLILLSSAQQEVLSLASKPVNERQKNDVYPVRNKVKSAISLFKVQCNEAAPGILRQLV